AGPRVRRAHRARRRPRPRRRPRRATQVPGGRSRALVGAGGSLRREHRLGSSSTVRWNAWLILAATLLLWSGNWIVARAVREEIAPGIATAGRILIVLAILLPFAFAELKAKWPLLSPRDWKIIAALGFTGGGVHLGLQWLGLHYLSTTPVFIMLMSMPLGERVRARQWLGVLVSFSGVFLIATRGEPAKLFFNIGDLMALASMMMCAG